MLHYQRTFALYASSTPRRVRHAAAGGEILATDAIRSAYHDGRGSIPVRGKVFVEGEQLSPANGSPSGKTSKTKAQKRRTEAKPAVIITELPYQTNKASTRSVSAVQQQ